MWTLTVASESAICVQSLYWNRPRSNSGGWPPGAEKAVARMTVVVIVPLSPE